MTSDRAPDPDLAGTMPNWQVPIGPLAIRTARAALQDMLMAPRAKDAARQARATPWRIRHAVGADVVTFFTAPAEMADGIGGTQALGYSEVFIDDPPNLRQAIAVLLADAIWFDLRDPSLPLKPPPLLLLPPIDDQIERIVHALGTALVQRPEEPRPRDDRPSPFDAVVRKLAKSGSALTPDDRDLLWKATITHGPGSQLRRLRHLLDEARLCGAESSLVERIGEPFRSALADPTTPEELQRLKGRREYWRLHLLQLRGPKDPSTQREIAEAMARLEQINRRLARSADGSARLLYITGDTSVFRIARDFRPLEDDDDYDQESRKEDFASLYLRHPRAYLGEPGVLTPQHASGGSSLADLLTVWLGDFAPTDRSFKLLMQNWRVHIDKPVLDRLRDVSDGDVQAAENMRKQWRELTAQIALPPPSAMELIEHAAKVGITAFRQRLEEHRAAIEQDFDTAFNDLFGIITELRLAITYTAPHGPRERPGICFESANASTALFVDAELGQASRFDHATYRKHREALTGSDTTGYFLNLAHAWLLASFGHWKTGAIFARRALAAVPPDHLKQPMLCPTKPNGREAAYLLAVCLRHSASDRADVVEARHMLDRAADIAKRESMGANDKARPPDVVDDRFEAERLSAELTSLLLDWAAAPGDAERRHLHGTMLATAGRGVDLAAKAEADMATLGEAGPAPADMPPLEHRRRLRAQIIRRMHRNALGVALMEPGDPDLATKSWQKLGFGPSGSGAHDSAFAEFQDQCAAVFLANHPGLPFKSPAQRKADRDELEARGHELDAIIARRSANKPDWAQRLIVFPYDAVRFRSWVRTALRYHPD